MHKDFDPYAFGNAIRNARNTLGYSQRQLGLKMGVSQQAVGKLEAGPLNITLHTFTHLCDALGADPMYMLNMWKKTERTKDA